MRRIDAIVFDMDGTLLDSSATVPAAYAAAIRELCGRECTDQEIIDAYSAGPAAALISRFIGRDATSADVECWLRHLEARLTHTRIYPGVPESVRRLAGRGVRLGVFTGATRRAAELQLHHSALRDAFAAVVGSDEVDAVKPAPDGLHRACHLLGVPEEHTAYVGDALNDLRCARAAGVVPVAAAWGHLYEADVDDHVVVETPAALEDLVERHARG